VNLWKTFQPDCGRHINVRQE